MNPIQKQRPHYFMRWQSTVSRLHDGLQERLCLTQHVL